MAENAPAPDALEGGAVQAAAPPQIAHSAPPDVVALLGKIADVWAAVTDVTPTGYNSQQNYAYASDDDLIRAVRPALVDRRLVLVPALTACYTRTDPRADRETGQVIGTVEHARVDMTFTVVDTDTGATLPVTVTGSGMDVQDKAIAKACTSAFKTFLRQAFALPDAPGTGPAPEPRQGGSDRAQAPGGRDPRPATEAQGKMIYAKLKSAGVDDVAGALLALTGKPDTRDLDRGDVDRVVNALAKGWQPGAPAAPPPPASDVPAEPVELPAGQAGADVDDIPF